MNSQQAQIQELIQSIDAVLSKASPRLPWVMAGESEQQRQLLERTRQYLVGLQQSASVAELPGSLPMGALPADPTLGPIDPYPPAPSPGESAQQVLQAVLQEVTYLRTNIMQPMRGEVDDLRLQRDALVNEIKELEVQRQQYALPPQVDSQQQQQALTEFLQSLMGRLQENLTVQVAEMLTTLESRTLPPASEGIPSNAAPIPDVNRLTADYIPPLTPQERLAQLQRIQTQSDQLLLKLDTTLRVIFESLQRNIQTYEDSLSQGLDKMHTLGHQGEAIFTALVNRLAQQLGREASQYLQSSLEGTDWQALPGATGRPLSGTSRSPEASSPLDSLMDELAESEATILQPPMGDVLPRVGFDNLNRELDSLELAPPPQDFDDLDAGEMTMFQMDEGLMATRIQDDDMTIFQMSEAAIAPLQDIPLDDGPLDNSIDDIDSALELLNQISSELETEPEDDAVGTTEVASPEGIYDELDALYQSLFGADVSTEDQEPPVDRHVADAEQAAAVEEGVDWDAVERAEQLEEFESQFFEGLADLSEPPLETDLSADAGLEAGADQETLEDVQQSPQTLEQLLFDEVPIADEGEQEDTQLLDLAREGGQTLPADVITSLEDLITLSDAASLDALRSDGELPDDDIYIPASPDEDLLTEAAIEAPRVEIEVDEDVLQQLDAELSSLEGREPGVMEEEISFLSDLSEEPEDISTSLEEVFRDPLYGGYVSPAATVMQEHEGAESPAVEPLDQRDFLTDEGEPLTDEGESLADEDEPLVVEVESLMVEVESLMDEDESLMDEVESLLNEDEPLTDEDEPLVVEVESLMAEIESPADESEPLANIDFFLDDNSLSEDLSANAMELELLPDEAVEAPAMESLEVSAEAADDTLEDLLTPATTTLEEENLSAAIALEALVDESLESSAGGISDDLLESLLEEIPAEAFEEENLSVTDDALLERLLEEEPASEGAISATTPGDEDWLGFDLPELTDSAPPPPALTIEGLEEGEQPPLEDTPEETAAFPPATPVLPPDREDLTLENFQSVMATPPLNTEEVLLEWPGDEEDVTPPQLTEELPELRLDLSTSSTEETLDSFANALDANDLNTEGAATAPDADAPEITSPLDLASWFDGVEDTPAPVEITPPGAQVTSLEDASSFLDALTAESAPAPNLDDNAFTLEGLGNLFEALPDSPSSAPTDAFSENESAPEESTASLGTDFGLAGMDLYDSGGEAEPDAALSEDPETAKKKDLGDRPPEALVSPLETAPPETEAAIAPEAIDYTSDLILQAIGLQADGEPAIDLAEEALLATPEEEEPDLALMELTSDLLDEDEEEVDPDLAILLQRIQGAPMEVDAPGDLLSDRLSLLREQEDDLESLIFSVTDVLEDEDSFFTPPALANNARRSPRSPWYLGIDLGTTGISAVLLNRQTATVYPLFWLEIKFPGPVHGSVPIPEKTYRLPTAVYATLASEGMGALPEVAIASLSTTRQEFSHPTRQPLRDFKSALRAGIPYYTLDNPHWEPVLQWSDQRAIPLSTLHQALRALLSSLNYTTPELKDGSDSPVLNSGAVGLSDEDLQQALQSLAGVVVSHPANWSDTYRFNVREAILAARLVEEPAQIYLMEESIATLLSAVKTSGTPMTLPDNLMAQPDLFQAQWQGGTLVMNGGASVTEMALLNLPDRLSSLSHEDFAVRTLPYGGNALDQDIICQLIYPTWVRQAHRPEKNSAAERETGPTLTFGDDMDWADPWAALGWEHLTLPIVGDPDLVNRQILQQRFQGAGVGLGLLEAARYLKLTLQQQDRCTLILGQVALTINRQDLGSRVLLPYIQRLNRELNGLLTQTGIPVLQVNQVLCSGGSASLAAIARWLRQKLPNATIVQDTYAQSEAPQHNHLSTCSRVAYGLAAAPLYPQVFDQSRHRYSDYFLLMELLRVFPEAPITLDELLRILERRGIAPQTCRPAIVALLEGHLPAGLVPADWEAAMLTPASQHNSDYQALLAAPLFVREADQTYRPNPQQWQVFRRYLDTVLSASYQKLTEPLEFGVGTMPRV